MDEVYSRLVYETEHVSIAALPGMRERTVLLDGFSKAYAMTGWRVGYVAAPRSYLEAMLKVHQYAIMCAGTAPQEAAFEALRHGEEDVQAMHDDYDRRRRMFVDGLNRIGLPTCEPRERFTPFPYISFYRHERRRVRRKAALRGASRRCTWQLVWRVRRGYVRCAYCTAYDQLEEALVRMERFMKNHS